MKRILVILLAVLPMMVAGQMVQPVTWTGETVGDSVRLTAVVEPGWHMTLISIGDEEIGEEIYETPYTITLAQAQPIRFNACDDQMCTAPAVWEYTSHAASGNEPIKNSKWRQVAVVDFPIGIVGRIVGDFYTLRVADNTDDGELLPEERRRTEGCGSLWAEYRYSVRGIRIAGDGTLWRVGA